MGDLPANAAPEGSESTPLVEIRRSSSKEELKSIRKSSSFSPWGWWRDPVFRTLVLVNIAAIVEKADEALLPAVYKEIGDAFKASPSALGAISLARALVQALSFPLAALLVQLIPRVSIVALGALVWGLATGGVGLGTSFLQITLWRGLNGLGLALVIPAIQSLVADSSHESQRGVAFGWLQSVTSWGNVLGGVVGVSLAGMRPFGLDGWRVAFFIVAVVSILLSWIIHACATDPPSLEGGTKRLSQSPSDVEGISPHPSDVELSQEPSLRVWAPPLSPDIRHPKPPKGARERWHGALKEALEDSLMVLRIPSFCIIVLQGVVGSFPWGAFSFGAMWLELMGFSHGGTAVMLTCFTVGMCFGNLFGGWFGDRMARRYPNSGRIIVAQISSGFAVLCSFVLLRLIPGSVEWWRVHLATLIIMGFLISWNAPATNNPIFAEIVPEKSRTNVYALDRTFEVAVAAFAPTTAGYLAETFFGYKIGDAGSAPSQANAEALAGGLFVAMALPWLVCCLCYSFLYWTYPADRDLVRMRKQEEEQDRKSTNGLAIERLRLR